MCTATEQAKQVQPMEGWTRVSSGSLHAMYALKTSVLHQEDVAVDEAHPHTYRASPAPSDEKEPIFATQEFF